MHHLFAILSPPQAYYPHHPASQASAPAKPTAGVVETPTGRGLSALARERGVHQPASVLRDADGLTTCYMAKLKVGWSQFYLLI